MDRILTIARREVRAGMNAPGLYIVVTVFLLITGWLFATPLFVMKEARLDAFLDLVPLLFAFLVPAMTMRLMAEEVRLGTAEILMTLPLKDSEIILGKYLGALALVGLALAPTLWYPAVVGFLGPLDWGATLGAYLGLWFLGAAFAAVGLWASCMTRNQMVAFILGFAVCFGLYLFGKVTAFLPAGRLGEAVGYLGVDRHVENISKGVLDVQDLVYFASLAGFFLFFATSIVNSRRWR